MIVKIGNIFESHAQTLVNTVNCVGVMGKGIALEFKKRYPKMYSEYATMCSKGLLAPGKPYYYEDLYGTSILNFPTKDDWRSPSKLSYIVSGLKWFKNNYEKYGISFIAFPPLGCGNGGLTWDVVGPIMYNMLKDLPIDIEIYAPFGTAPEKITFAFLERNLKHSTTEILGTKDMPFNKYWYLILYVVQKLNHDAYSLCVGRTIFQKVCYILTRVGIPTGFTFIEGSYGPYSKNVKSAITALSNANYMTEKRLGNMVETVVSPDFVLNKKLFTEEEIKLADKTYDLLCRIKSTDQAEVIATVLFSYDEIAQNGTPTEQDVLDYVMNWKPHWKNEKQDAVTSTIYELSSLEWISPNQNTGMLPIDNLF